MQRLKTFLDETDCVCEFSYLMDLFPSGTLDETWVPQVASGGWIVITADRGKQTKGGPEKRLPLICESQGVSHVLLGASLHQLPSDRKLRALIGVWDSILEATSRHVPARIRVNRNAEGNWHTKVILLNNSPKTTQRSLPDSTEPSISDETPPKLSTDGPIAE
jgi:hypothetical protein